MSLEASKRYEHWIKKVADQEEVWGLWQEGGWALAGDEAGRGLVPVWPHPRYAALCADGVWAGYRPKAIALDAWLDRWIRGMERDHRLVAVFPTPNDKGVPIEPRRLERDLRNELANYE
ncbi:MAG TPA: DUF2750 domain-containing protein [Verrucomicrobiota bacterium]|nr:DUF2750 domain-containing protein [Verrucomicrobiota bacterium]